MEKKNYLELDILREERDLGRRGYSYVVMYDGKEWRVPMFSFQIGGECPAKVKCVFKNNEMVQDTQVVAEKYYRVGSTYLFTIKKKWPLYKYYELQDRNVNEKGFKIYLRFSDSRDDLREEQQVECIVNEIRDGKPFLTLTDANPSCMEFKSKEEIFKSGGTAFTAWIDEIFKAPFLGEAARLHGEGDGKWVCLFSKEIETVIYSLIVSDNGDKAEILEALCRDWTDAIEYSTFMGGLSVQEKQDYNYLLTHSIEVCEDFMDALLLPGKDEKAKEIIKSLDPQYYRYRIEKRFRTLACIFSLEKGVLDGNIDDMLDRIGRLGMEECSSDRNYKWVMAILKMCAAASTGRLEGCLSVSSEGKCKIKRGILSLCYLAKVMSRRGDADAGIVAGRAYLLASAYMLGSKEKSQLLGNAYLCLFAGCSAMSQFKWEQLDGMVKTELYRMCSAIPPGERKSLVYANDVSYCKLSPKGIKLAPRNYRGEFADFKITGVELTASISYSKSLSRIEDEDDFLDIRNAWREVGDTVATPVRKIEECKVLQDGEVVDVYVTGIKDDETMLCRAVGYGDEGVGEMEFNDLLFYRRPNLSIDDFVGTDGSGLVFPAIYSVEDGRPVFYAKEYKVDFAIDVFNDGDEVLCKVITVKDNGTCVCVTADGLFMSVNALGNDVATNCYIMAEVTGKNRDTGYAYADFVMFTEQSFAGRNVYAEYLKAFNKWCYDGEMTLDALEAEGESSPQDETLSKASRGQMLLLMDVLNKLSELEDARRRYCCLAISKIVAAIVGDEWYKRLIELRMKYTEQLYSFSLNNKLQETDTEAFRLSAAVAGMLQLPEVAERLSVLKVLCRYGVLAVGNRVDDKLLEHIQEAATPLEKELATLVLSGNLLSGFRNDALRNKVLDEIGNALRVCIIKPQNIHIGEEGKKLEFKTSLVYPPGNHGNEGLEEQTENILHAIMGMMNADGGELYIGVNDNGNVVGLYDDLVYFSRRYNNCNEEKAKDNFKNYFSWKLQKSIGYDNAARFEYEFEEKGAYSVFHITIPKLHVEGNNVIRVGTINIDK